MADNLFSSASSEVDESLIGDDYTDGMMLHHALLGAELCEQDLGGRPIYGMNVDGKIIQLSRSRQYAEAFIGLIRLQAGTHERYAATQQITP